MHDESRDAGYIPLASGIPDDVLDLYGGYYSTVNPFMRPAVERPVGVGFMDDALVPPDELARTEFFNDFLKPYEMPSRVALTIDRDQGFLFVLATLSDAFDDDDKPAVAEQFTRLGRHLRRASDHYRRNGAAHAAATLGDSLFDAVDIGLIVVGEAARVKTLSETGQRMLRGESPLGVSPLGRLLFRSDELQAVLTGMLERTYAGPKVVNRVSHGTRLTLIRVQKDHISLFFEGPTIIVLMEKPGKLSAVFDVRHAALMFDLSAAEARALSGIVRGKSINEIAAEASVSRETIRSQLKGVYAKTGVRSQVDLIRLALSLQRD